MKRSAEQISDSSKPTLEIRLYAFLLSLCVSVIGRTCRVAHIENKRRLDRLLDGREPAILAAWHNRVFYFSHFLTTEFLSKGGRMAMLSSLSKDGEIGAHLGNKAGARVVRGSASRGGTEGFRRFYRLMKKEGCSTIILPDGSKGPKYQAKMGVAMLAKMTGAAVVPMSYAAESCWRIPSWDQMIIPKPFSRISLIIGDDITIRRDTEEEELEDDRKRIEQALICLNQRAASVFNARETRAIPAVY